MKLDSQHELIDSSKKKVIKKKKIRKSADTVAAYLFLAPNILGFLAFTAIPLVAAIILSFYSWPLLQSPEFVGIKNYTKLFFNDPLFLKVVKNTLYYVGVYLPVNLIIALCLALWLCTIKRGSWFFRTMFFLPVLTPTVASAFIWKFMFSPDGLVNQMLSLVNINGPNWLGDTRFAMIAIIIMSVWKQFGYNMVIFIAGIQAIPKQLYEAAMIDGANSWQRFCAITIPMLSPALFFGTVMTVITSFQVFDQAVIMTDGGPVNSTNTIVMYIYQNGFKFFNMGYAASIAMVLFSAIFVMTMLQMKLQRKYVHYE
ncbi:carbohydrate ABC transporter permease [Lederbergia citrea]|uniref:carbohydrate ABC transporter permease n=1 Tax=Lederbergia citrea TaxID=2833581 RepID=UPI001BC98EA8|nr:sugar ABC transporter permease [Lederbergia citrea]MBS4179387.1 sugar ABC transporter permease [Lederbergia citrea]